MPTSGGSTTSSSNSYCNSSSSTEYKYFITCKWFCLNEKPKDFKNFIYTYVIDHYNYYGLAYHTIQNFFFIFYPLVAGPTVLSRLQTTDFWEIFHGNRIYS